MLREIHEKDPELGYRFLADELLNLGYEVSERRVWRHYHVTGFLSVITKRRRRNTKAGAPVGDDLVEREFTAEQRGYRQGTIVHSDRGGQLRSQSFQQTLAKQQLQGSMGRVGAAGDIAAMESFFSLLQKNVLDRKTWETRLEMRLAIVAWIEVKYHRKRGLGRLTPIEFEVVNAKQRRTPCVKKPESIKASADPQRLTDFPSLI